MGSAFGKRERFGMCQRQGRYPDNLVGAPLMRAAFHADSGSLTDTTLKRRSNMGLTLELRPWLWSGCGPVCPCFGSPTRCGM